MAYEDLERQWRSSCWSTVLPKNLDIRGVADIYLFGVFAGKTTIEWTRILKERNIKYDRIICFDSFEGIPLETAEPVQDLWNPNKSHFYKAFNASDYWKADSVEDAVGRFIDKVMPHMPTGARLSTVHGFFEDSLTDTLKDEMKLRPAFIIDIDVDIYTSTKEAMDWMFDNDLLRAGLTQVGYDDWGGTPGYMESKDGESRAHKEISQERGAQWDRLTATGRHEQVVFRYEGT